MHRIIVSAALLFVLGCAPAENRTLSPGRAGLALELVDAPNRQVKEINVTIKRVTAHSSEAGWVEVFKNGPVTVDLLTLKTRVMDLGFANLPAGKITQIRLYLEENATQNVVLPTGEIEPLKVPSGVQSGIKIKGPFDLGSCNVTTVQLDFDGHKSIWYHPTGNGGDWILRPVIRTKKVGTQSTSCNGPAGGGNGSTGTGGGSGSTTGGGNGTTTGGGAGGGSGGSLEEVDLPGQPGQSCISGSDCLSGACQGGTCGLGGQGTPCRVNANCISGICNADGSCAPNSSGTPTLPSGSACQRATDCASGVCTLNVCMPGLQGQPCNQTADCDMGFTCMSGACEPELN